MSSAIADLQRRLTRDGFPCGRPDGAVGPRTRAAVLKFQHAFAGGRSGQLLLARDAVPGPRTIAAAAELPWLAPHFNVNEFRSKGDGTCYVRRELVLALERYRATYGPLSIISGYRDPEHNDHVGGAKDSMHVHGCAADVPARQTVDQIRSLGLFGGIGYDRRSGRVSHVDVRQLLGRRPAISDCGEPEQDLAAGLRRA